MEMGANKIEIETVREMPQNAPGERPGATTKKDTNAK
jgi:hypothetical protein